MHQTMLQMSLLMPFTPGSQANLDATSTSWARPEVNIPSVNCY